LISVPLSAMIPTFSGNSRRPRNVNLSGRKNSKFLSAWAPSSGFGRSDTLTKAEESRKKRQLEKKTLEAAQTVQRIWRGARVREDLRALRRDAFDSIYRQSPPGSGSVNDLTGRLLAASPIICAAFQPSEQDLKRIVLLSRDMLTLGPQGLAELSSRLRFATILENVVASLRMLVTPQSYSCQAAEAHDLLAVLPLVTQAAGVLPKPTLSKLYQVLANVDTHIGNQEEVRRLWAGAVITPLSLQTSNFGNQEYTFNVYESFAFSFLCFESSSAFRQVLKEISETINISLLSSAITSALADQSVNFTNNDKTLWLFAHVIDLVLSEGQSLQLTLMFSSDPKNSFSDRFRITAKLAGYILCLCRCFPQKRDQINLQLFLCDIKTLSGPVPFLQHLLSVALQTGIYCQATSSKLEPLTALNAYFDPFSSKDEVLAEWTIIILALDLYSFLLRLTDDDDFFSRLSTPNGQITTDTPRIQRCNLAMKDIIPLSQFLRDMSFPFYNNLADLESEPSTTVANEHRAAPTWPAAKKRSISATNTPKSSGTVKLDLPSLKSIITTALTMIYERDSRRRFFPEGHWLMTTKFNMSAFLNELVLEHERQTGQDDEDDEDEDAELLEDLPLRFSRGPYTRHAQEEMRVERMHRDRLRSKIAPRLEVLRHMPFVIPFETRVEALRKFISVDMAKYMHGSINDGQLRQMLTFGDANISHISVADIVRGDVFDSAFKKLWSVGSDIKKNLRVSFVDQFGIAEAGIDGGGITKEFLISITNEAFGQLGLFTTNSHNQYYPDSSRYDWYLEKLKKATTPREKKETEAILRDLLARYEFLGRILGKCIYSGILIDVSFAPFFLLKCTTGLDRDTGFRNNINDLRDLDEQTYQGLVMLKNAEDATELGLDFTVDDKAAIPGKTPIYITRKLVPNGDKVSVTNENRLLYASYFARHRLVVQPQRISTAFLRGLWSVIMPSWISMFNQWELQRLIGGDSEPVNLADWRANTEYSGIYVTGYDKEEHPVIKLFWELMEEFSEEQRRAVLQFVTSVPRAPLLGFSQLNPRFAIRDSRLYGDNYEAGSTEESKAYRFPTASTCLNLFKLPPYRDKELMRAKILAAISANIGFGLS
ncbi:hypothetical protein TD95_000291, partial [Thielaviopsis punctulata]